MNVFRIAIVTSAAALSACGTIEHYEVVEQPVGRLLVAGVGDVVLRVNRQRDLENVAGRADLWGRKTDEGYIEVRYMGIAPDGSIMFSRQDLTIRSNETTVTRMGAVPVPVSSSTRSSGMFGSYNYYGTSTTTGTAWAPAPQATTMALPSSTVTIRLAPGQPGLVQAGRYALRVEQANSASISYSIGQ